MKEDFLIVFVHPIRLSLKREASDIEMGVIRINRSERIQDEDIFDRRYEGEEYTNIRPSSLITIRRSVKMKTLE